MTKTSDKAALDQWYAVETSADLGNKIIRTRLLGQDIELFRDDRGLPDIAEMRNDGQSAPRAFASSRIFSTWRIFLSCTRISSARKITRKSRNIQASCAGTSMRSGRAIAAFSSRELQRPRSRALSCI